MSCCESCGGITLFKGEDGNTVYNGVGAPTIVANEGDFYIDTNTYEIYGPYTGGLWGSGTSLVGPAGAVGAAGVGITNIAWTSNSGGQPQGTQGTTDTYTITLSDASTYNFLVTNGADGVPRTSEGVSTTDGVNTIGATITTIANNSTNLIEVFVTAREVTTGSEWGSWKRNITVTKFSGTTTLQGTNIISEQFSAGLASGSVSIGVVTNNPVIRVQGIAATNISWNISYDISSQV
jgi:hypothetical protein